MVQSRRQRNRDGGGKIIMAEIKKFEESLAQLENIVKSLENDLPLDDAVKAFEKGIELSRDCMECLKAEKGKLNLLINDMNKLTEDFKLD